MDWTRSVQFTHLLRTRAYLTSLPSGLASHPDCCGKASVWRNILEHTNTSALAGRLPDELALLFNQQYLHSAWLPVAHSFAGHLVLRDCLFSSDDAMFEHFRLVDRQLISGVLYSVLFAVASPAMMVQVSDRRFGALFKGIDFRTEITGANRVQIELTYPTALVPPLVGRLYLIAFEVIAERAGAKDVRGRLLHQATTGTRYELAWQ